MLVYLARSSILYYFLYLLHSTHDFFKFYDHLFQTIIIRITNVVPSIPANCDKYTIGWVWPHGVTFEFWQYFPHFLQMHFTKCWHNFIVQLPTNIFFSISRGLSLEILISNGEKWITLFYSRIIGTTIETKVIH